MKQSKKKVQPGSITSDVNTIIIKEIIYIQYKQAKVNDWQNMMAGWGSWKDYVWPI